MEKRRDLILLSGLIAVVIIMAGVSLAIGHFAKLHDDQSIGVFDIVLDKNSRKWADIVFDHPIAVATPGEIISPPPASIEPGLSGVWRWRAPNVLRFEPAGPGFPIGNVYRVSLNTKRLLTSDQHWRGDDEVTIKVDGLLIEKVVTTEESAGDKKSVVIKGEIHFNYSVDPELLITKASIVDGTDRQPIDISGSSGTVISFRSHPIAKRSDGRVVKLILEKGIAERSRGARLENDFVQEINIGSSDHLTVRSVKPTSGETESTLTIDISSQVSAEIAPKFLTVKPAVKYHLSVEGTDVLLVGAFIPGSIYTVAIAKGLPALDDAVLDHDYSSDVTFPDLESKIDFQSEGMFLSASGYKTVAIESTNIDTAAVAVDRVYRNNIFNELMGENYYARYYDGDEEEYDDDTAGDTTADGNGLPRVSAISHTLGDPLARKKLNLRKVHNKKVVTTVSLAPMVKEHEPGLYRVMLYAKGKPTYDNPTRWILITDLGVVAKRGTDDLVVWVSSFANLAAVADANVTLVSDQNQVLTTGRTDSRGLWIIHDLTKVTKNGKKKPFLLKVEKGNDFSFLAFGRTEVDVSPFDVAGDRVRKDGYSAFVYGERDIYRPGETVEGLAVIRNAALEAPPAMPLVVKHHDGNTERESLKINATDGGIAPFTLKLPAYARTGHHRLDVIAGSEVIGTYNFQVEEFVPDRIKVEIKATKPFALAGEDLSYDVSSAYLFGPPAAELPVETRVRLVPSYFGAKGFESYTFGNNDRKFDARELANDSGSLDEKGLKNFKIAVPKNLQPPGALEAIVSARVQEQGGRGVAAVAHIPVHPWPYYLGVRRAGSDETAPAVGKPMQFEWVAVSPDGKEMKGGALKAEFFEDEWHCVLRKTSNGGYAYQSTREPRLLSTRSITAGTSRGTMQFVPAAYRTYRVVLTDPVTGASSALEFYAGGWGYSPWAIKNPGRLQLDLDKDEYAPGEEATLQVKSPFAGKLFITLERDDVYYTTVQTITGNSAKIKLPLTAQLRPNGYVTATLVRAAKDLEPGEAGRAFGAIPINLDRLANKLAPAINVPADLRSSSKLPVEVTTEPNALVTIAAVDEGILQLIAQKTPDPHAYFYRKLALGVETSDIFAQLLPEVKPKGKGVAGGGEDMQGLSQYVRADSIRRVKPVAFWSGALRADGNGKARFTFDIPDFQGGVRVMAVMGKGRHFGSSDAMVHVHDPLVLMPTFPRFLNVRDQISVPVTVRNDTGKPAHVSVVLNMDLGSQPAFPGDSPRPASAHTVQVGKLVADIPNGAERTVYIPLQATPQPADLALTVTATGNGQSAKASATIPVRWDLPLETVEDSGRFNEPAALFRNDTLQQFVPGSVERTLVVSPLPFVQFKGKLSYLLHYPYGCVEQTTSSVFPLIYFSDLAEELDPEAFKNNDSAAMVREGIRRLGMMQVYNGGFAMWPYGSTTEPWLSVYATHFLVEAKRAGHDVPQPMLDRALAYIGTDARAKSDYDYYERERAIYSLYVLARAGKADLGTMDYFREHQLSNMTAESRALLAAAYAATGNPKMLDVLLGRIADVEEVSRATAQNYDSTIRNRALLLMALLDINPGDPRVVNLVERLTRDLKADFYWSTHESSFALVALGQLARQQHVLAPYEGTVFVDRKPVGTFTGKTAVFRHIRGSQITVKMNGKYNPGAAYYALSTRGVKTSAAFRPETSGIEITRRLLTRDGAPLDGTGAKQGDLLVCEVTVKSTNGALNNVVVQNLIPSGLEVENPRLKSSETFTWITGEMSECTNLDIRDDQVLYFVELGANQPRTFYTLLRAVTPGVYQQPPMFAEAMYSRRNHAVSERGTLVVR